MKARIFGAGSIGNHLSNALRKFDYEVEVIDIDKNALIRMRDEIYPSRYGEWDKNIKLREEPSKDFVDLEIIGTPPDTHAEILIKRIEMKKSRYWLVEKPFTFPNQIHIKELERKIKNQKDKIFIGYNHSVSPAFLELIKDLDSNKNPTKISCKWIEHWGGIFKAHPWLSGPNDSYLGFKNRGGGALMEHSHGLHLLMLLFQKYKLKIKNMNSSILMDKNCNYDKRTYISFQFEDSEIPAFYLTDVITNEVEKSIKIETQDEYYQIIFGSDNGTSDTYFRKNSSTETIKKFRKNRADDFINEIGILDKYLKNNFEENSVKNINCDIGLKVALVCANIFENNKIDIL